jgi:hypothetical protein
MLLSYRIDFFQKFIHQNGSTVIQKNAFSYIFPHFLYFYECVSGLADFWDLSRLAFSGLNNSKN